MKKSPIPVGDEELSTRELVLTLNKRLIVATIAANLGLVAVTVVLFALFPLKESVPYIVKEKASGELYIPSQTEGEKFVPLFENKAYFLRRWITDSFTINQYTTVDQLDPRARIMLRGANAIAAYGDLIARDKFKMMADDPTMVRDAEVLSITPIAGTDNGAVADIKLIKRQSGKATEERKIITIYYDILPLKDRKDVEVNPVGLFITDFKLGVGNV